MIATWPDVAGAAIGSLIASAASGQVAVATSATGIGVLYAAQAVIAEL
jgi:hypothetical protein